MFRIEKAWRWGRLGEGGAVVSGKEAKTFGSRSGKNEVALFPTDVSLGTAATPHDIIQRFPW